jgi:hypothetical protein
LHFGRTVIPPPISREEGGRAALLFGLVASTGAILVLCHGLLHTGSWFTAAFISLSTIGLLLFSHWRDFRLTLSDVLFAAFAGSAVASLAINGFTAGPEELALLMLSLAAYPASRLFANGEVKPLFVAGTALIVALGVVVTAFALIAQWNSRHGKPMVFGEFDAAPTQFLTSLGLLLIAAVCVEMTVRRTVIIASLSFVPVAIFAASQVRFTFVAIAGGLALAAVFSGARDRKAIGAIMLVMLAAIGAGLWARGETSAKFLRHEIADRPIVLASADRAFLIPVFRNWLAGCPEVDGDNSIAIRKKIYAEALDILPIAGPLGIGLDGFMKKSCVPNAEVHNSLLQVTIELGWLTGAAFTLLLIIAIGCLIPLARNDLEARFVSCSLVYLVLLTMVHGRISRDAVLFLFLGYAASIYGRLKKPVLLAEAGLVPAR